MRTIRVSTCLPNINSKFLCTCESPSNESLINLSQYSNLRSDGKLGNYNDNFKLKLIIRLNQGVVVTLLYILNLMLKLPVHAVFTTC